MIERQAHFAWHIVVQSVLGFLLLCCLFGIGGGKLCKVLDADEIGLAAYIVGFHHAKMLGETEEKLALYLLVGNVIDDGLEGVTLLGAIEELEEGRQKFSVYLLDQFFEECEKLQRLTPTMNRRINA